MCSLFLVIAALVPTIWVVDAANGPGANFTDLQPAVNAAASGDVILVRPGTYAAFAVSGKALTIRGSGSATTIVANYAPQSVYPYQTTAIIDVPGGATFYIDGIGFNSVFQGGLNIYPHPAIRVKGESSVALADVIATGMPIAGSPGLYLEGGASVHAVRSTFTGGFGPSAGNGGGGFGSPGAWVTVGCGLVADACTFAGGIGGYNLFPQPFGPHGGQGVLVSGGVATLTHCSCYGGYSEAVGVGGDALTVVSSGFARVAGTSADVMQGGSVQSGTGYGFAIMVDATSTGVLHGGVALTPAAPGAPLVSGTVGSGPPLPRLSVTGTSTASGEILASQPANLTLSGLVPFGAYIVAFDLTAAFPSAVPGVIGDLALPLPPAAYFEGVLDGAGLFSLTFVPATVPGLTDVPFYAQSAVLDPVLGAWLLTNLDIHFYRN